ncbi:MAG TPA: glycosyltransferase family 4 protein [Caulobacteraceae bacterium]|jgi:glycosyltransferase involved in cell wall biosynthesis|nr:glycosyltransferase family 4 protein [Caulobacteraceae bacterium]
MNDGRTLVLSVFATFAVGGPQVRFAALANHYGRAWRHAIIAMDGRLDCAERLSPELEVSFPRVPNNRGALLGNVGAFQRFLEDFAPDVLLTHNWGSIEWAMARHGVRRLRHVHVEDGFGPEEAERQLRRRVLTRRLVLRESTVVLPSLTLLRLAARTWRLPRPRLLHIPNGLDLEHFRPAAAPRRAGPPRVGTVAALRTEKNLGRLLGAARRLLDRGFAFQLVIVGDGPERARLQALAAQLGIAAAAEFTGAVQDPAEAYRSLDAFALSSDTEQMPYSVLEAMATGLPVAATGVGDVRHMLATENQPFVCDFDETALAEALGRLLGDATLRRKLGVANRRKAEATYGDLTMFRRYAQLLAPERAANGADK